MTTEIIRIDSLRRDGGTQPRATLDPDTLAHYSERMLAGDVFPPVAVFHDGADHWVWDGFHRLGAADAIGRTEIEADVRQGTLADAQWFSASVNDSHGLRRSRADVQRAIETALRLRPTLSDREIADHVHCNHETVGARRAALSATGGIRQSPIRTGKDGRTTDTSKIGKSKPKAQTPTPPPPPIVPCWPAEPDAFVVVSSRPPALAFEPHDEFSANLAAVMAEASEIESLTSENAQLRQEIERLTAENTTLREQVAELTPKPKKATGNKSPRNAPIPDDPLIPRFLAVAKGRIKEAAKECGVGDSLVFKLLRGNGVDPHKHLAIETWVTKQEGVQ